MFPAAVQAADLTWDNGSGNFLWDTTSLNWTGATWPTPSSGSDGAIFAATGVGIITNQTGGITANNLTFNTAGYTLVGDPLTLDGTTPSITNGVNAAINANLVGSAGLLKIGNGTLTLGGTNSGLSGGLTIGGATSGNGGGVVLQTSAVGGITSINIQSNSFLGLAAATVGSSVPITAAGAGGFTAPPGTIMGASGVSAVNGSVSIADGTVRLGNQNGTSLTFNGPVTAPVGSSYGLLLRYGLNQGMIFTNSANYWEGLTALSQGSYWFYPGALPTATRVVIAGSGNAWLETSGSLTRSLGTTGTNQIDMSANAAGKIVGLSARGGNLTVNFGGAGGTILWGSTAGFNPAVLGLNGTNANGNLTLQNDLDLNGAGRTVEVDAGVAEISGIIKNSSGTAAALTKAASAGVLLLSRTNTYNGGTTIAASTTFSNVLRVSNGSALGTNTVTIGSGGNQDRSRLELTGGITVTNSFASFTSRNTAAPNFLNVSGTNTITANISSGGGGGQVSFQSDAGKLIFTGSIGTRQLNLLGDGDGQLSGSIPLQAGYGLVKSGNGTWTISGTGTYPAGLTLNAGTLNLNSTTAAGAAASVFTINGGTLDNTSAGAITLVNNNAQNWNGNFAFTGTKDLNLGTGAVTMNASRQVTVNGGKLTVGGAIGDSGSGFSLTKLGVGTLELGGVNTYAGSTIVSNGTLKVSASGSLAGSGGLTVASGATLETVGNQTINLTPTVAGNLTVGGAGTYGTLTINGDLSLPGSQALNFDLSSNPSGVNDQIAVSGALNLSGITTLNINFSALGVGTYHLVTCSTVGSGTLANLNPVYTGSFGRFTPSLQVTATGIDLNISGVPVSLTWAGVTNLWDNSGATLAWTNGTSLDYFLTGDNVTFNSVGIAKSSVLFAGNLTPGSVTVDTSAGNYSFNGAGKITGSSGLTKNGSGTLQINNTNDFTGTLTVNAGTLQLGDGSATTGIVAADINNSGSVVFANPSAQTYTGGISGGGALTKSGAGILTLAGSNSLSGNININAGTLKQANNYAFDGAGGLITLASGATLELGGTGSIIPKALTINGGSLTNRTGSVDVTGAVTLNANTTIATAGTLAIHGAVSGNVSLTTIGVGTTILAGTNTFTGPVTNSAGTLQIGDGTTADGSLAATNIIANGTVTFAPYTSQSYTGNITGGGTLTKTAVGNQTLNLSQTNSLGLLRVQNGSLDLVGGVATLASNPSLNVGGNGNTGPAAVLTVDGTVINCASRVYVGGDNATGAGILNLNSGSLTAPEYLMIAYGANGGAVGSVVNVNGGTLTANIIRVAQNSPGNGTLWLNGGLCAVNFIDSGTAGFGRVYFNGGILQARSAQSSFISTILAACNVSTNLSTIDNAGFAITISRDLTHDANVPGTDGGLRFTGTNVTTLTGSVSYTGPTVVQNSTLLFSSDKLTGGGDLILSNATLNLTVPASTALNVSKVGLTNATLMLNYGSSGNLAGSFNTINASGDYAASGTNSIVIQGSGFVDGMQIPVVKYAGSEIGAANYVISSVPIGYSATVLDDSANQQILVTIYSVPGALTWKGTSNLWNTNSATNITWVLTSDLSTPEYYTENFLGGSPVNFDDNVAGGLTDVILNQTVTPFSVSVSGSGYNYSITGSGKISGLASLTKSSTGTLVLGTANDYTNGTYLNSGTIVLTNGSNRLPVAGVLTFTGNGTLDLGGYSQTLGALNMTNSATSTSTVSNGAVVVTGSASLTGNGAGAFTTLNMSGANSLTMNNPSSSLAVGGAYGATAATSGAELFLPASASLTLNQLAIGTFGAINNTAATNYGWVHLGQSSVVNVSQITLGTTRAEGTLDFATNLLNPTVTLRNTNGASSRVDQINVGQNGAGGTIQGFGLVNFSPGTVDALVSNLVIGSIIANSATNGQGTMTFSNGTLDVINMTLGRNYTVGGTGGPNGTFDQFAGTNKVQSLALGDNSGLTGTPRLSATYNLVGGRLKAQSINAGSGTFSTNTSSRIIHWSGGVITHYDASTDLTISGASGGNINVIIGTNGIPAFVADSGRTITVGPNAVISGDASGLSVLAKTGAGTLLLNCTNNNPGLTVVSNGVFGGTGTLAGLLSVNSGATLSPGASGIGTLTVSSNLVLTGNLYFELNKSLVQSNDYVSVGGGLTNLGAGTLTLTNVGVPALAAGDSFKLFSQPVVNGNAFTLVPTTPGAGLVWTNLLAVNGTIAVITPPSSVATNSIPINFSVSGGSLNLSWPPDHLGWRLEAQTNSLTTGLSNNWVTVPGSTTITNLSIPINAANGSVFYRLVYP